MDSQRHNRLQLWLRIDPAARPKIYSTVYLNADLGAVSYWLEILLSAGIATLGLVLNSPAVIIGAMLISPLMDPIMATGLGLAAGDLYLALKAVLKLLASIVVATALSAILVWLLPFHSPTAEILGRTNPTLLDLGIALLSGIAGSIAVSRSVGSAGGVTTVPGVAIAVALMPPLCTVGYGIGSGFTVGIMRGAGLLFLTNIVAIVFSAFVIFLLIGINTEEVRIEMKRCRAAEPFAHRLARGPFAAAMRQGGQLRWSLILLVAMLTAIAWPLQIALHQLTAEARTRDIVEKELRQLVPQGQLVLEQTEVGQHSVAIHVIATVNIAADRLHKAEVAIASRSGRQTSISAEGVASQSELAKLVERFKDRPTVPVPVALAPTPPHSIQDQGSDLVQRVEPVLTAIWPKEAPLQDFSVLLTNDSTTVQVHYSATRPLTSIATEIIARELREKLNTPNLLLDAIRVSSRRTPRKPPTR